MIRKGKEMTEIERLECIKKLTVTESHTCLQCGKAKIILTGCGGVGPYAYSIDGGKTFQSSPVFEDVCVGTYYALVTDSEKNRSNVVGIKICPRLPRIKTISVYC